MDQNPRHNLLEILKKLGVVMVVTQRRDGGLHGRPMAVAEVTLTGELWFATSRASAQAVEILADARALVTGQDSTSYASVTGALHIVEDRERVRALWSDAWKPWFPAGKEDPDIVLMRFRMESGEYWSVGGVAGVRYLFEAAKALVTGERAASPENPEQHGVVRM